MQAPLFSTITLIAEVIISSIIYYTFYKSYKYNKFPAKLAGFAILYEIVFNVSYMVSRVPSQTKSKLLPPFVIALAIIHGVLSLIMFVSLIVFLVLAFKNYKKGVNYFKSHRNFTAVFLIFWTISIVSGILFYFLEYYF